MKACRFSSRCSPGILLIFSWWPTTLLTTSRLSFKTMKAFPLDQQRLISPDSSFKMAESLQPPRRNQRPILFNIFVEACRFLSRHSPGRSLLSSWIPVILLTTSTPRLIFNNNLANNNINTISTYNNNNNYNNNKLIIISIIFFTRSRIQGQP